MPSILIFSPDPLPVKFKRKLAEERRERRREKEKKERKKEKKEKKMRSESTGAVSTASFSGDTDQYARQGSTGPGNTDP